MKKNKKKVVKKPLAAAPKKVETSAKKTMIPAKKVVIKKKTSAKTTNKKPSEVKKAIAEIKKLYGKLNYLNTAKVEVLSEISKKETALCERFDYNMAKLQDIAQSGETARTTTVADHPNSDNNSINLLPPATVSTRPPLDGLDPMYGLNACAIKY